MYGTERSENSSILRISRLVLLFIVCRLPPRSAGTGIQFKETTMLNLVEKYTAEATAENEDGVVAIEYVLVAGLVAIGVGVAFGTHLWTDLLAKLNGIVH